MNQVKSEHYDFNNYINIYRWLSYKEKLNEILKLKPKKVLEIGIGSGLFTSLLTHHHINVTTVDYDKSLAPDYVSSVEHLPFKDNMFDVVVCFQVLEHLEFSKFQTALKEIKRVSSKYILLSLPDRRKTISIILKIPFLSYKAYYIQLPRWINKKFVFDGQHYWEINVAGYEEEKITRKIKENKIKILKNYRIKTNPYHRLYVLENDKND